MNALKKVKKFGTSGIVFRRGQQIVLENEKTTEHVVVKVVQHDSIQGWLAENGEGDWQWYREHKQEHDFPPFPLDRKSTRLNSSHIQKSRMPSSA